MFSWLYCVLGQGICFNILVLQSAVDEVIERMDEYYISKEDWDTIIELGVDEKKDEIVMKNISTATKTALTRKWVSISALISAR